MATRRAHGRLGASAPARDAGAAHGSVALEVVEGVVEAIVPGGRGLLRHGGGVVFARGALPGERVEVGVHRAQGGVRHGVVLRVLEPSPHRIEPDCPQHGLVPGTCGGCDLLALAPDAGHGVREHIVDDALLRVGRLPRDLVARARRPIATPSHPRDPHGPRDALRRRVRVVMAGGKPSFSSAESHARALVDRCPALHPTLDAALALLPHTGLEDGTAVRLACDDRGRRSAALEGGRPGDARRLVEAGVAHGAIWIAAEAVRRQHDPGTIEDDGFSAPDSELERAGDPLLLGEVAPGFVCGDGPARSDASVFSQATRFGGRAILEAVLEAAAVAPGERVLELFAGSGHLTVPLLHAGASVHAIEGAPRAVAFLKGNVACFGPRASAQRAFIDGTLGVAGPVDGLVGGLVDVLVADPPRTGIPGFRALLSRICPARIVLVSCDPATGARDIGIAVGLGYALSWVAPIDAFPRTSHVEWVAALRRES